MLTRTAVVRGLLWWAALALAHGAAGCSSTPGITLDLGQGEAMKLVLIRPGEFLMGSPDSEEGRGDDENQHAVTISKPFYMGATEVTQAQYTAVMGANPARVRAPANPVETVSWTEAADFCRKLSEKTGKTVGLPTEAQWEYACRAGSKTRFSFGDSDKGIANYAWHAANATGTPHPVGQKKPNAWGLYDMHGNVWEWCADWYGPSSKEGAADPQGPASGDQRVLRGGAWVSNPIACRAAYRVGQAPDFRYYFIGFRVAMPAAAVDAK